MRLPLHSYPSAKADGKGYGALFMNDAAFIAFIPIIANDRRE